jgi:hypothetical protein
MAESGIKQRKAKLNGANSKRTLISSSLSVHAGSNGPEGNKGT